MYKSAVSHYGTLLLWVSYVTRFLGGFGISCTFLLSKGNIKKATPTILVGLLVSPKQFYAMWCPVTVPFATTTGKSIGQNSSKVVFARIIRPCIRWKGSVFKTRFNTTMKSVPSPRDVWVAHFVLKKFDGTVVSNSAGYKNLILLEMAANYITERSCKVHPFLGLKIRGVMYQLWWRIRALFCKLRWQVKLILVNLRQLKFAMRFMQSKHCKWRHNIANENVGWIWLIRTVKSPSSLVKQWWKKHCEHRLLHKLKNLTPATRWATLSKMRWNGLEPDWGLDLSPFALKSHYPHTNGEWFLATNFC